MTRRRSPPQLHLQTTTQILKTTTTTIFFSGKHHLISFLILSFLLFNVQNTTHVFTHFITSYIDNIDTPSINTILTRIKNPPKPTFLFHQTQVNATFFLLDSFDYHVGPTFIQFQENVTSSNDSHVIDLKYNEVIELLCLIRVYCVLYGVMVFGWVHGVVFVLVVNHLLKTRKSLYRTFTDGSDLGISRLTWFVAMRILVWVASSQLLCALFFSGIKDKFTFINVYIWLKFLPFSLVSPLVKGYEYEFWWIMFLLSVLDWLFSFVLDVCAWVVMVDPRKRGREVIDEGCHMFSLMFYPALNLKFLEFIIRCLFVRTTLKRDFGEKVALTLQSFMEVYFMVAWLVCYFSAKSVDANSKGIPFGRRELKAMVNDLDHHH